MNKAKEINSLALAYLGDAIYEIYIRKFLINKNIVKVNDLQKEATKYVSAKSQSEILKKLIDEQKLKQEEIEIIKRARNHKCHKAPKNTDINTYKNATGLEALIGYLELINNQARIEEVMEYIVGE